MTSVKVPAFKYADLGKTPPKYVCKDCKVDQIRLFRPYGYADELLCRKCCLIREIKKGRNIFDEYMSMSNGPWGTTGDWRAAVPCEDGDGWWSNVPEAGCKWFDSLPDTVIYPAGRMVPYDSVKEFK